MEDNDKYYRPKRETPKAEPQKLMTRGEFYMELMTELERRLDIAQDSCMVPLAQKLKTAISVLKSAYKADDLMNLRDLE